MVTDNVHRLPVRLPDAVGDGVAEITRNAIVADLNRRAADDPDAPDLGATVAAALLTAIDDTQAIRVRLEATRAFARELAEHPMPPVAHVGRRLLTLTDPTNPAA